MCISPIISENLASLGKWREHEGLLKSAAWKLAKAYRMRYSEVLGSMYLRLHYTTAQYDETKGAFSTLFYCRLWFWFETTFQRRESEYADLRASKRSNKDQQEKASCLAFATYEQDFHLYRVPDRDDSWAMEVVRCFDTPDRFWNFVTTSCTDLQKEYVFLHFREDRTYQDIGEEKGTSKQAVEQVIEGAKRHIKKKVQMLEDWMSIFLPYRE